tara:strand:+ start:396 stop:524 length:129 start_codon:yes stop_codon:yes gene_type:complete
MSHDLEDMIEMIKAIERRLIDLERKIEQINVPILTDSWYWNN